MKSPESAELTALERRQFWLWLAIAGAAFVLAYALFEAPGAFVVIVAVVAVSIKNGVRRYRELSARKAELRGEAD